MPTKFSFPLTAGHNSKRDPGQVGNQLITSQGCEYKTGDPILIHKIPGRSLVGSIATAPKIKGMVFATYDDATAFIIAVAGTKLYYGDISNGVTATFTNAGAPQDFKSSTVKVSAAHFNNRWFVVTGNNDPVVVESDATVFTHGMTPPSADRMTITGVTGIGTEIVSGFVTSSGSWFATAKAGQQFDQTAGYTGITLQGLETAEIEYEFTSTASFTGKNVELQYMFNNRQRQRQSSVPRDLSDQPQETKQWSCKMTVEVSTDNGSTFSESFVTIRDRADDNIKTLQIPVLDAVAVNQVHVKVRFQYLSGAGRAGLRLHSISMHGGGGQTTYTNTQGGIYYAVSEYDSLRNIDSAMSDWSVVANGESYTGVQLTLPPSANSANATHFRVWKTTNQNAQLDEAEFGLAGQIKVGETLWTDVFTTKTPAEISLPLYEFLILDEFGVKSYYDLNDGPPNMDFIGNFKGALFGLKGRSYYQAITGRPFQWPAIFAIERFPFKENSPLFVGHQIGDTLWLGGEAGCVLLDHPIETKNGSMRIPAPRRLEGAPGCVGSYAATPFSMNGESLIAWVSNHGVVVSNMATFERVTEDIDWESDLSEADLTSAVLFWREKNEQLALLYDSTGDGDNDKYMLIHMGREHRTPKGQPLITLGHAGKLNHWVGGRVGGVWREYTGDSGAGASGNQIYLEGGSDTGDASLSHDDTTQDIPFDAQTGRLYFPKDVAVLTSRLFHTVPTTTISLTVAYTTGRDKDTETAVTSQQLQQMSDQGRSKYMNVNTGKAGEFMQWRLQHTGQAKFSLGPIDMMLEGQDDPGSSDQ